MPEKSENRTLAVITLLSILVILLHIAPFLWPHARLWGFNHLLFLKRSFLLIFAISAVAVLAVLDIKPTGRAIFTAFERISILLFSGNRRLKWSILALAAIPLFYFLRLPVHILGDSVALIGNLDSDMPVIFKWSETGAIYSVYWVSRLLGSIGIPDPADAYVFISIISGSVSVWFFLAISRLLGRDTIEMLAIFWLQIFAGWSLLFFGYVENYPILWPLFSGYIYFSLRAVLNNGSLIWPMAIFVLASIVHLMSLFLALSLLSLIAYRHSRTEYHKKNPALMRRLLIFLVSAGIALFIWLYYTSYEFRLYMMPFVGGRQVTPRYWLFSPKHLIDILNQLLLLVPALPLLLYLVPWKRAKVIASPSDRFLLWLSVGGLIFLFLIEPKLGMARDWDLFALCGLGPLLFMVGKISVGENLRKRILSALALLSLVLVFPFFSVYMQERSALECYESLLHLDISRARTGLIQLHNIYSTSGRSEDAERIRQRVNQEYPSHRLIPQALKLIDEHQYEAAAEIADEVAQYDSESPEYLNLRGLIFMRQGKHDSALAYLEPAARLGRYDYRFLVNLSELYYRLQRYDDDLGVLRRAQKLAPDHPSVNKALMANFFTLAHYDSASVYARRVFAQDSSPDAIYVLGFAAYEMREGSLAEQYFKKYLEIGDNERKLQQVAHYLETLEKMKPKPEQKESP